MLQLYKVNNIGSGKKQSLAAGALLFGGNSFRQALVRLTDGCLSIVSYGGNNNTNSMVQKPVPSGDLLGES